MIIHDVEQNSPEWYRLRAGMPTASNFSKVVTSDGTPSKSIEQYALTLAAGLYAGEDVDQWGGNKWTDRGHDLEAVAVSWYEFDRDVETKKVGFITDDDGLFGCSPDRLVGGNGLLEVKCLKAENHIKMMGFVNDKKVMPSPYVAQCQGQMMIAERSWCDLLFFHDVLPPFVVRGYMDMDYSSAIREGISKLIESRDKAYKVITDYA